MVPALSAEFSLAAACAIWPPSDRRTEVIRRAAAAPIDWARFLRVVNRHQLFGLVHDGLLRVGEEMPAEIAQELRAQTQTLAVEGLTRAAEEVRLQGVFDAANLPVLFLKGTSLAVLAYGNVGLRQSKDIDLLVAPGLLEGAIGLLESAGYRRVDPPREITYSQFQLLMPRRKDITLSHPATGLQIELHWHLFLNRHAMDERSLFVASRSVLVGGTSKLRTLGEEDLFTYLCIHGALHLWNRLKWLADIGAMLAAQPDGGIERLKRAAEARSAGRAAAVALLLCQRLLGTQLPTTCVTNLGVISKVSWLEERALAAITAGGGEREWRDAPFATSRGLVSAFLLGPDWRYRVSELRNLMYKDTDVLVVPLPEWLRFLYPIMRLPLWIWRRARRLTS